MGLHHYKNIAMIKTCLYTAIISAVIAVVLKSVQIVSYFDASNGLIAQTTSSNALNILVYLFVLITIIASIKLTIDVAPSSYDVKIGESKLSGYILFSTAFLFFFQGITGLTPHINQYQTNLLRLELLSQNGKVTFLQKIPELLPIITDFLCILSSVAFVLIAIACLRKQKRKRLFLLMIPVLWSTSSLVCVILAMSNAVSMQSNADKVIASILVLLFLYYLTSSAFEFEEHSKRYMMTFFKISLCTVSLVMVLPYVIALLFGMRDTDLNMPYLAFLGLIFFGFYILADIVTGAIGTFKQKNHYI